jgi:uncharacterized protein (DUF305 family)
MRKFPAIAALALGLSLTLTACGSDDTDSGQSTDAATQVSTTEHNDADVAFATDMIQHHAQALSMVDLTMGRDLDPDVQALADDIRAAQAPEIEQMSDWLQEWGEEVPETVRDHANAGHDEDMDEMEGHDMGGDSDMPGMMSADDMRALKNASDAEFQDMWRDMMIEHHQGAVAMAQTEEADGRYKPAVDMAKDIQKSQTAEIDKMKELMG